MRKKLSLQELNIKSFKTDAITGGGDPTDENSGGYIWNCTQSKYCLD